MRVKTYRAPTSTLRLVNPSLSAYRERWRYCVGGWLLIQESPK